MAYSDSPIQEIKERLDIVDIVREYVPLQQAGTNWKARCPFHNEKTPSFMVSKEKQIWHCFGCDKGGDVFGFVKEIEGIEFPEALRILAEKAGVVLKRQDPQMISVRTRLLDLMNEAVNFFVTKLKSDKGGEARRYLSERGLSEKTLEEWQLGFAPEEWEELSRELKSKGFSETQILNSGMAVKKQQGQGFYDRFRGRIMFPIANTQGQVVGFSGRVLVETDLSAGSRQGGGKYMNTPQTALYEKSRVVFGLDKAKQEIRKNDLAVVVEGQMDVIQSHQAGVKNVVASSGTALTSQQLDILSRYTKNLAFSFDADAAGEQATGRGIDLALEKGMNVKIIQLEGVKDPDECIKKLGVEKWQEFIKKAKPIMRYYFDLVFGKVDISDIEGKREAARQLLGKIVKIAERIEQDFWTRELASRLDVDEKILRESVRNIERKRMSQVISTDKESISNIKAKPREVVLGERLVALGLKFPGTIEKWSENFEVSIFGKEGLMRLAESLRMYYNQIKKGENNFDYNEFRESLELELQKEAEVLVMLEEKDFEEMSEEEARREAENMTASLRKEMAIRQLKKIEAELKQAEEQGDKGLIEDLSRKLSELIRGLGLIG